MLSSMYAGVIGGDYNAEITRQFAALTEKSLGISKDRFYIKVNAWLPCLKLWAICSP